MKTKNYEIKNYEIINYREHMKDLYSAGTKEPKIIKIPTINYLMFNGTGTPAEPDFQNAATSVYTIAYILKFMVRDSFKIDYKVMPMEVKWVLDRINKIFHWTMMIMQPAFINTELYNKAIAAAKDKKKAVLFERIRFEAYHEGKTIQMLHKGPYEQMNHTLKIMKEFATKNGLNCDNDTHDIYFNDVRKTKPENLRTIMRVKII